ncbi:unnamed protein product [Ambrosiozyma monospora]|uniref:Unnamed protein product n=1 Tax=Ambrosiozyma monospora TaxID=43982 RepID=A0A9W6YXA6_AMBMO|nr:unnamed protein product [Ambrosiozyma monospora]
MMLNSKPVLVIVNKQFLPKVDKNLQISPNITVKSDVSQPSPHPINETLTAPILDPLHSGHRYQRKAKTLSDIKKHKQRKLSERIVQNSILVDIPEDSRLQSDFTETTTTDDTIKNMKSIMEGRAGCPIYHTSFPAIDETLKKMCIMEEEVFKFSYSQICQLLQVYHRSFSICADSPSIALKYAIPASQVNSDDCFLILHPNRYRSEFDVLKQSSSTHYKETESAGNKLGDCSSYNSIESEADPSTREVHNTGTTLSSTTIKKHLRCLYNVQP